MQNQKRGPASPFDELWEIEIPEMLRRDPDSRLTNSGVVDTLMRRHPQHFTELKRQSLLRTLGRQIKRWRRRNGYPPQNQAPSRKKHAKKKGMVFPQEHPPGQEAQVAFTDSSELFVSIRGQPFEHRLYNFRLSHSGWSYVEAVSEDIAHAVAPCLTRAITRLGNAPKVLRTDRTNAAIKDEAPPAEYARIIKEHGMQLSLANPYRPWELGGVRADNHRIKQAIEQALLIRGSRDFEDEEKYRRLVQETMDWRNTQPEIQGRLQAELAEMRPAP